MKITDFLSMDDVFLLDNVKNKFEIYEKVFPKFIEIENNAKIERNILINKIEARGNECSFVIKEGFAIPHARFEKIEKPILKFCFVKNGKIEIIIKRSINTFPLKDSHQQNAEIPR